MKVISDYTQGLIYRMLEANKSLENTLKRVRLAKQLIASGFFFEEQITILCEWLGFNDTAFRCKDKAEKLEDFLLSEDYWINKLKKESTNE